MLSISLRDSFEPTHFNEYVRKLPTYQRPVFIRIVKNLSVTETMKYIKNDLKKEGFDIHKTTDCIYIYHPDTGYSQLTEKSYQNILSQKISQH
ncbi:hypothetical protein HZS_7679 [Henneguya salminicola]|nr:hypothetical protein HZS_7679 [Henneguya salminicola]